MNGVSIDTTLLLKWDDDDSSARDIKFYVITQYTSTPAYTYTYGGNVSTSAELERVKQDILSKMVTLRHLVFSGRVMTKVARHLAQF